MLTNPDETLIVSSLGWVEKGSLWTLDTRTDRIDILKLSDANYLSLHDSNSEYFSVVHHYDGKKLLITAHSFEAPNEAMSKAVFNEGATSIEGDKEVWKKLPKAYVAYLQYPSKSDSFLLYIDMVRPELQLIDLDWYDSSYDKDYQGVIGAVEVPGTSQLIISVQRDSNPILYDLEERKVIRKLSLAERHGNPTLKFRRMANELWADDYDTILSIDPNYWKVKKYMHLQGAAKGAMQFIGNYKDETLCAVARPFSADVVAIDTTRFKITHCAKIGRQPLEVALLSDGRVYSRDWKTGEMLKGKLKRKWFA
ncbi:MAG: hypothetical protein EPN94_07210 [Nitrospirae bacterium]|nr:MAG: hypothetical protein EPN94_07210 [Nitrospirota bacterium]